MTALAPFAVPIINDNDDGWGPPLGPPNEKLAEIPYAPFSKSDKVGKAADWQGQRNFQQSKFLLAYISTFFFLQGCLISKLIVVQLYFSCFISL